MIEKHRRTLVAIGIAVGVIVVGAVILISTGVIYLGPTLVVTNDEASTVQLKCDRTYDLKAGRTTSIRLGNDGLYCQEDGAAKLPAHTELCIDSPGGFGAVVHKTLSALVDDSSCG